MINPYLKIGAYKNNSRVSKNTVILKHRQVILLSLQAYQLLFYISNNIIATILVLSDYYLVPVFRT